MSSKDLANKIAQLEFQNDQLLSELQYLDEIARKVGFIDGLNTLKSAALDLIIEREQDQNQNEEN